MTSRSHDFDALARDNETAMLRALASAGQKRVAETLELSESTVSRWKEGDLEKTAKSLAAMGLKVVLADAETIEREDLDALIHGAKEWAASLSVARLTKKNPG